MLLSLRKSIFIFFLIIYLNEVRCDSFSWNGGQGNFDNSTFWNRESVPGIGDVVYIMINGSVVSTGSYQVNVSSLELGDSDSNTKATLIVETDIEINQLIMEQSILISETNSQNNLFLSNISLSYDSQFKTTNSLLIGSNFVIDSSNLEMISSQVKSSLIELSESSNFTIGGSISSLGNSTIILNDQSSFQFTSVSDAEATSTLSNLTIRLNENSNINLSNSSIVISDSSISLNDNSRLSFIDSTSNNYISNSSINLFNESLLEFNNLSEITINDSIININDQSQLIINNLQSPSSVISLSNLNFNSNTTSFQIVNSTLRFLEQISISGSLQVFNSNLSIDSNANNISLSQLALSISNSSLGFAPYSSFSNLNLNATIHQSINYSSEILDIFNCFIDIESADITLMIPLVRLQYSTIILESSTNLYSTSPMVIDNNSAIKNLGTYRVANNINFGLPSVIGTFINLGDFSVDPSQPTLVLNTFLINNSTMKIQSALQISYLQQSSLMEVSASLEIVNLFNSTTGSISQINDTVLSYNSIFELNGELILSNSMIKTSNLSSNGVQCKADSQLTSLNGTINSPLSVDGKLGLLSQENYLTVNGDFILSATGSINLFINLSMITNNQYSNFIVINGISNIYGKLIIQFSDFNNSMNLTEYESHLSTIIQYQTGSKIEFQSTQFIFPSSSSSSLAEENNQNQPCISTNENSISILFQCGDSSESSNNLSKKEKIGIALAVISLFLLLVVVAFLVIRRQHSKKRHGKPLKKSIPNDNIEDPLLDSKEDENKI